VEEHLNFAGRHEMIEHPELVAIDEPNLHRAACHVDDEARALPAQVGADPARPQRKVLRAADELVHLLPRTIDRGAQGFRVFHGASWSRSNGPAQLGFRATICTTADPP